MGALGLRMRLVATCDQFPRVSYNIRVHVVTATVTSFPGLLTVQFLMAEFYSEG